jgi:4-hydroxy-tetrahydrodipicolinate reductase
MKVFDSKTPLDFYELKDCDVAIAFLPSEVLLKNRPLLIKSEIPLISGATGHDWPESLDDKLKKRKYTWMSGSNFSLGMRIMNQMISKIGELFSEYNFNIHEVHHIKKLDAPSGTAKLWKETYERVSDTVDEHTLSLQTPFEIIQFKHEALDRRVFAKGALWPAKLIHHNKSIVPGLCLLETLTDQFLNNEVKI